MNTYIRIGIFVSLVLTLLVSVGMYTINHHTQSQNRFQSSVEEHADDLNGYELSPAQVVQKIQSGIEVTLLDLRSKEEYEKMHLQNSVLIATEDISLKALQALGLEDTNKEIIVYGRSSTRGKEAYDILKAMGYRNVKSIAGGMVHWQEDAYPLIESGAYTGPTFSSSETKTPIETGPKITFDRTFEPLRVIPQYGGTVTREFVVSNTGTDILEIGDISTSCSCTSASIVNTTIAPGEQTILSVVFDPDLHSEPEGVFTRTVFIPSNDPHTPEAEVTIEVDIAEGE